MGKNGVHKMYKGLPALQQGQLAFKLNIEVPDSAFENLHQSIDLNLSEDQLIKPPISVEVGNSEDFDESEDTEEKRI